MNSDNISNIEIISNKIRDVFMEDEWYDIAVESHFWLEWRLIAILKLINQIGIPINKKLKVLEVGSGNCVLRNSLEARTDWTIDAADLNLKALSQARPSRGRTLLYDIFDEEESIINSYDVVLLMDVLEHIELTNAFIKSLIKHIKPGGHLLINVPALNLFYSVYDKKMGHFRRYNKKSLISEFRDSSLNILDTRYWGLSLLPLLIMRFIIMIFIRRDNKNIIKSGFKPPGKLLNKIFLITAKVETKLFSKPLLGSSLLLVGEKNHG